MTFDARARLIRKCLYFGVGAVALVGVAHWAGTQGDDRDVARVVGVGAMSLSDRLQNICEDVIALDPWPLKNGDAIGPDVGTPLRLPRERARLDGVRELACGF